MNKLLRIPFTDRALVIADDPHGQAERWPGGLSFNTTATAEHVRGGEVIDRYELGSGVITTAGINKWAAMLNAKQGPLYTSTTTALGPYMIGTGTGTTAPAITDTGLQTAIGTTGVAYSSRSVNLLGFNVAGVAYGNGVYVAVGGTGGIATSTDAVNWTVRVSPLPSATLNAVAFGNNTFVAGTNDGQFVVSVNNGTSWSTAQSGYSGGIAAILYANSLFIASSNAPGGSARIFSSSDGTTWTSRLTNIASGVYLQYVNGKYLSVGAASGVYVYGAFSSDGLSWQVNSSNSSQSLPVVYVNSKYVYLFPSSTSFTQYVTPYVSPSNGTVPYQFNWAVTNDSGLLVLVGNSGSIYTSTNVSVSSSDYVARTSGTTANLTYVTYQNGQFIAFAGGYAVLTSSDGVTWVKTRTAVSASTTAWFSANSTYLMWGGSEFARSANATTWYKQPAWFKFTTSYSNPYAVSEFGIFGGNTTNNLAGATLFDRRTFTPINVTGGDSINWYWGVTGAAGG